MRPSTYLITIVAFAVSGLAGCASSSNGLLPATTGTVPKVTADATKQRAERNAKCMKLQNRIIALRSDGTIGKVEKAATGKTRSVRIKRAALAKVVELNQANSEYQTACSSHPMHAETKPMPDKKAQAGTSKPAKKVVAAKTN